MRQQGLKMTVEKLLRNKTKNYFVVAPGRRVIDVIDILVANDVGAVIVSDNGISIDGILSERDVIQAMKSMGRKVFDARVADLMTKNVVTCQADYSVSRVMALMINHRIRHVPVVDGDIICGLVSIRDIIELRLREVQKEAEDMRHYIAGDDYNLACTD